MNALESTHFEFQDDLGSIWLLRYSFDGQYVFGCTNKGHIIQIDMSTKNKQIHENVHEGFIDTIIAHPNKQIQYSIGDDDHKIKGYNYSSKEYELDFQITTNASETPTMSIDFVNNVIFAADFDGNHNVYVFVVTIV